MSAFSGGLGREEEDGGGWGSLVPTAKELRAERLEAKKNMASIESVKIEIEAGLVEENRRLRETLQGIVDADWRKWQELASPEEFVRWAKARANHALVRNSAND